MVFPSPVGGLPLPLDFAPTILFAVLYGLLLPLLAYRIIDRRSRTWLLFGTSLFAVERVVVFGLRAMQATNESRRLSRGFASYMQSSFGSGYTGISWDLVSLARCLLVNPTFGFDNYGQSSAAATKGCHLPPPELGEDDRPRERYMLRRLSDLAAFAFFASIVPGIIANSRYSRTFTSPTAAHRTYVLRYVSTSVALFLLIIIFLASIWSRFRQHRSGTRGILIITTLVILMSIVSIFRLAIMHNETVALDSTSPGSMNTSSEKAAFYVLHVLPEWVATVVLLGCNIRKTFGTGAWGDWRRLDETPEQREKRERKAAARAERKRLRQWNGSMSNIPLNTLSTPHAT
ncbi:hypothetical protein FA15DRAFT_673029 [Coprinopsis marcescibilis]|uniref:Uncharacterized protein n=1 Tax=Coprinopsis marcescibilis TaxID=230819 RepID=A0A5C3KKY7_COPMA|nr:hypothetical protein FA15DRAFT_673029 [Coprinopsis marcescibilis]